MEITLKSGRKIGDGHPPYIIAEIGSNWTSLEDCLSSIHQAKIAGADAVKFQMFTHEDLYGFDCMVCDTQSSDHAKPVHQWNHGIELDPKWLPKLKAEADKRGIDFMCTAFSPEGYDLVNTYVDIHKVASSECCHLRILQKLRQLGKPVILSTGAKGVEDIHLAVDVLTKPIMQFAEPVPTILMYCVVAYPANEIDLKQIRNLRMKFDCLSGHSDHSTDVYVIPRRACQYDDPSDQCIDDEAGNACVLEKHFTIDSNMNTPDTPHSLNPDQFKKMVSTIRGGVWNDFGPTPQEKTALLRYNRRLVAIKDVAPGDTLKEGENFGIYRSLKDDTRAAHPFMIDRVNGSVAKVEIKAGDGIWLEDLG
jgi:sialic acid synthase SpsE